MPFPSRQAQTRIKHDVLRQYAGVWAGIITGGFSRHSPAGSLDLVYFDAFAGYGRYDGDADRPGTRDSVWGSPVVALRALAETAARARPGVRITLTGILVEENSATHDELLQNLKAAQLGQPLIESNHLRHVELGSIMVLRGDVRRHVEDLLGSLGERAFLLSLVDPFGTAMPMALLKKLVARKQTDVMTLFPVYRVHEYAGSAQKAAELRTAQDLNNIKRNTEHMGNDRWLEIAALGLPCDEAAPAYVDLYRKELEAIESGLVVKDIGLSFAGRAEEFGSPGYHLFLTTRNADGALRINEILRKAEYRRYWDHWKDREGRAFVKRDNAGILDFGFDVSYSPAPTITEVEVSGEEVKADFLELVPAGAYTVRQMFMRLSDSIYTRTEVNRAIRMLKEEGQVQYNSLKPNSRIQVLPKQ